MVLKLLGTADVLTENFRPGALDKLGFSYARLKEDNPRLIYCSLKGFLNGPYEHRPALDEVTQMMGGLAYMTGLPDRPLRAGSSVVDIMGGTFAAVAILAALRSRESTGRGMQVTSALFESTAYLVAQHMAQFELTGEAPPPMSVKRPAWSVYDIFETAGGGRLFIGVVTDTQWEAFCREFRLDELAADPRLKTNGQRVKERAWLIPRLNQLTREHCARPSSPPSWKRSACRSRRSPSPGTCSTIRTSTPPAASWKRAPAARRSTCRRCRSRSTASACASAPTRRESASTRGNCSPPWAVHRRRSKACATAV